MKITLTFWVYGMTGVFEVVPDRVLWLSGCLAPLPEESPERLVIFLVSMVVSK